MQRARVLADRTHNAEPVLSLPTSGRCTQACGGAVHLVSALRPSLLGDPPYRRALPGLAEEAGKGTGKRVSPVAGFDFCEPRALGLGYSDLPNYTKHVSCIGKARAFILRHRIPRKVIRCRILSSFGIIPKMRQAAIFYVGIKFNFLGQSL